MSSHQIYDYVERLSNLLRTDSRRSGAEYGLQPIQLEALHYLSVCNRYSDTPKAVTEFLGQTKGTVSQTLKVLEKKGLLRKHADSKDGRITHLKVSKAGKTLLDEAIPSPFFVNACQQLTEQSKTQITNSLKKLLLAVQASNEMKSFGACHSCRYNQRNDDHSYFCKLTQEPLTNEETLLICREHKHVA